MKDQRIRDDIIITNSEKGEAVIIDVTIGSSSELTTYNKEFYKEIPNQPTKSYRKKANNAIK